MKSKQKPTSGLVHYSPYILLSVIGFFLLASVVAGEVFGAYSKFWWWDDMLHTFSGVLLGIIGFLMVYFFNARYNMHISPVFVAVFAFTFAVTAGALWEVFEFSVDALLGAHMQRWNLPPDAELIGKAYQGSGLRDSMSDMIVASIGALIASVFAHYSYKNERSLVLRVMRRTFPDLAKKD